MKTYSDGYFCYLNYYFVILALRNSLQELMQNNNLRHLLGNIKLRAPHNAFRSNPALNNYAAFQEHLYFRAGLDHITQDLKVLLQEALYLNRTAIIPSLVLHPIHNFKKITTNNSVSEYYDLSKSFWKTAEGERKKLSYVWQEDFLPQHEFSRYRLRLAPLKAIIPPAKVAKNIIIARTIGGKCVLPRLPVKSGLFDFLQKTDVHLEIAAPLKKIAQQVLAKLGNYYVFRYRLPYDTHQPYDAEKIKKYLATRYPKDSAALNHFLSGEDLCKQLVKIFPAGSNLYFASNLWGPYDEAYLAPLRRMYKVYRYYDFPQLISFVEGESPNTAKLFLIEKLLAQHSCHNLLLNCLRPHRSSQQLLNT